MISPLTLTDTDLKADKYFVQITKRNKFNDP